jgi:phosphoglycolate phosphatase
MVIASAPVRWHWHWSCRARLWQAPAVSSRKSTGPLLILWDIDQTLIEAGGVTKSAYAAAFAKVTGRRLEQSWRFNGRTELAAVTDVLTAHGVAPTRPTVNRFLALIVDELNQRADQMRSDGRVLDGAAAALRACQQVSGVHQSVLTGNLYPLAALKMSVFGLAGYVDLRIGAFGGDGLDRAELPRYAWQRAYEYTGHRFTGAETVIIGDTLLDVAAGKGAGARVVAVATGPASAAELRAAGANVVLPSLADTEAVVEAVFGTPRGLA